MPGRALRTFVLASLPALSSCHILGGFTDITLGQAEGSESVPGTSVDVAHDGGDPAARDPSSRPDVTPPNDAATEKDPGQGAGADATADAGSVCPGAIAADPSCVPAGGNLARCATASGPSSSPSYPHDRLVDGDLSTSWYTGWVTCTFIDGVCPSSLYVDVALNVPHDVRTVKLVGNRDQSGKHVLTARIKLLDSSDAELHSEDVSTAPNTGDYTLTLESPATCVAKIRVYPLTAEAERPGMAEIEAYAD